MVIIRFSIEKMKVSTLLGIGAFLLSYTDALAIQPRHQNVDGVIHAPMWRRGNARNVQSDLTRRDRLLKRQTDSVTLYNSVDKLLYFANSTFLFDSKLMSYNWNTCTEGSITD